MRRKTMTDKTPLEILKDARSRITPPGTWTRFSLARNRDGFPREPTASDAYCFCALGAICAAAGMDGYNTELRHHGRAAEAVLLLSPNCPNIAAAKIAIVSLNDAEDVEQDYILAIFDRAIKRAGETA
jgi:hypothetical protein